MRCMSLLLIILLLAACGAPSVRVSTMQAARVLDLQAKGVEAIAVGSLEDPPTSPGGISGIDVGMRVTNAIQAQLSASGAFEVNTRTEMDEIKAAQQFNMSGYVNSDDIPESFQLTGTRILLVGAVHGFSTKQQLHEKINTVFDRKEYWRTADAQMQATIKIIDVEKGALVVVLPINKKIQLRNPSWSSSEKQPQVFQDQDVLAKLCEAIGVEVAQSLAPYKQDHYVALEEDAGIPPLTLGNTEASAGRWQAAMSDYKRAERSFPQSAAVQFNLGLACRALGDAEMARRHFKRAYELQPKQKYLDELKR